MLKTAILPSAFYPSLGGVEELVRQLAAQLRLRGRTPIIITNRWPRSLPDRAMIEGTPVYRAPLRVPCCGWRGHLTYWLTTGRIRRQVIDILRQSAPDLLHIQCVSGGAAYALHARRKLNLPFVVTLQGELTMDADRVFEHHAFSRRIMREALAEADMITACSAKTLADAEAFAGISFGDRARVIFNGARVEDFRAAPPHPNLRPYILAIGRLAPQKGFDVLLRALAAAKIRQWDIIIAGEGTERESLQTLARELGIADNVRFVGRTDRATTASLFVGSQFVAVSSRADEGLPVVIAEAMAAGKPVLGTRVGGVPEAVVDGETGLLVEREDVAAMTSALSLLAGNSDLRARMSAAATRRAPLFAWPTITDQYEEVYRVACERHRANAGGVIDVGRALPAGSRQSAGNARPT